MDCLVSSFLCYLVFVLFFVCFVLFLFFVLFSFRFPLFLFCFVFVFCLFLKQLLKYICQRSRRD